jgi:hypothetical protein
MHMITIYQHHFRQEFVLLFLLKIKKNFSYLLSIYKIKDLIASNGPLISRRINKRRLKLD